MGLPMGLGGGIKWDREDDEKKKDKKEKEKPKPKDKTDEEKKKKEDEKKKEKAKEKEKEDSVSISESSSPPGPAHVSKHHHHSHHHASGWSSILEDYFSRGIGSVEGAKPDMSPHSPGGVNSSASSLSPDRLQPPTPLPGMANKDAHWKLPPGGVEVPKMGPYELLTKERMMGIYLAVYVHRDVRPLIEGRSTFYSPTPH